MERELDYATLMKGIKELDFQCDALPSSLVLIGSNAFPLSMNARGQMLMAASRYGLGRIVVLGHEEYLTRFPKLVENALNWLMPSGSQSPTIGVQKSLRSLAQNLQYSSLKIVVGDFQTSDLGVYVADAYSVDAYVKELVSFLKAGGGLLIAGQAWNWAQSNLGKNTLLCFPGNKVCSVAGIYILEHPAERGKFPVPLQIPSSWLAVSIGKDFIEDLRFLLKGVSDFDIQGGAVASEVMPHGPLAFPIALIPNGRAFFAGAYYGQGRIIVATHESFLGRELLTTFLLNALNWLNNGRKGKIGIISSLKDAHRILSKSGLNCQFTNFSKDLSVFVCTAYDATYCHEIQEFVAEGGGLLIGGHTWYWAQSNPNLNVMTDCPANRILCKMGLCIMSNTLPGGVYKKQQLEDGVNCTHPYHFCELLPRFASHVTAGQVLTTDEEGCLNNLRKDCASYLRMQAYDSASYTTMVSLITDMVKKVGLPQVCHSCPVQSTKDKMMLHVGSEVYKVCRDPDALLPYLIKNIPKYPTLSNVRVQISANTSACEEWLSTGLYLSPGMKTYISVPPEIRGKGWTLQIGCQTDCLENAAVLKRAPVVHMRFALDSEMMQVFNLWGGLIYIIAPPKSKVNGVQLIVQTAVKAPYYKSGQTSVKDWVNDIRQAPAPWAELEFENLVITLNSDYIRKLESPDKVATLWDSIMRAVSDLAAKPAKFARKERFVADVQISHGFMHAGYPVMIHAESALALIDPKTACTTGIWGAIHELGHNQQCAAWEFPPHTTEATCNLWSVYVHEEVLGVKRAKAHSNITPESRRNQAKSYAEGGRNLSNWSVWTALETYLQLQEKFGWDAFKKVFATYQTVTNVPNNRDQKMNLYAKIFSQTVNMNLTSFFKAWGWPINDSTMDTLNSLPIWSDHPMAQYV